MSLAHLIRKRPGNSATAIPAIPATQPANRGATVAKIAKIALANSAEAANDAPDIHPDPAAEGRRLTIVAEHDAFDFVQNDDYVIDQEAHRQRCWQAFRNNAQRILAAPPFNRNALIKQYRADACVRYGEATAADMAGSLRNWIDVRGVH